jgi:anthranilate phosphoribosyltransferase
MNPKDLLNHLVNHQDLDRDAMLELMHALMGGAVPATQIAAFLIALRMKGETVTELAAATEVMRELSTKVPLQGQAHLVDTCGTGGDGARTFNISTAAAFVAAAAGASVAKHGGRSVSSTAGSADVLEALGVRLDISPQQVADCVRHVGVGFMFAPHYHSAMKHAAPVRRELGVRTLFNLLGPMANPAGAPNQVLGVFNRELTGVLARVLASLGSRHVLVVHAKEGLDELSLASPTYIAEMRNATVEEYVLAPGAFGFDKVPADTLTVNSIDEARDFLLAALENRHQGAMQIVALNAGAAIYVAGLAESLQAGVSQAVKLIASGAARSRLDALVEYTQRLPAVQPV